MTDSDDRGLRAFGGIDSGLTSYGDEGFSRYLRRAFLASAGWDDEDLSRPIVGIAHTISDYVPCHREMPGLLDAVRRGVLEAGGLPLSFPTMSLGEILLSPTSMLFRNLMAMETEELLRAQPMDAVVLLGGCDKTVPAQLMAAISADIPAVSVVTGSMTTGSWRGERLGACTDCRSYWQEYRAGRLDDTEITEVRDALCETGGTCMVMGTASTMACLTEALGMTVRGGATPPAPSGARLRVGTAAGRLAVEAAVAGRRPSEVLTRGSFLNAVTAVMALGGSTNSIVHLLAIARRAGVDLTLDDIDEIALRTPLLVDCKPSGVGYMEDFHRAGGMPVLLKALQPLLELEALGVDGLTLEEHLAGVKRLPDWQSTIRSLDDPLGTPGALRVLRGNLAPDGGVIKVSAASPELLEHRGPAVVFESPEDVVARIDSPDIEIEPDSVLVLRNAGPVAAGMPESGSVPIPRRLAAGGVRDMVRVTDGRMSGTAYGTIVLHIAPEAAVGGPIALVRDGDPIRLSLSDRRLDLEVPEEELARRRAELSSRPTPARGWRRIYSERVTQADRGADLDVLEKE